MFIVRRGQSEFPDKWHWVQVSEHERLEDATHDYLQACKHWVRAQLLEVSIIEQKLERNPHPITKEVYSE